MNHLEDIFIEKHSIEKIGDYLACFSNWNFLTSNNGRSVDLWEKEPIYTWNGWKNDHDTPVHLSLIPECFFGEASHASKFILNRKDIMYV